MLPQNRIVHDRVFELLPCEMFSTQVNLFLNKCTQAKKRRKRSMIGEGTKVKTETKKLKTFEPVEKSPKLTPTSDLTGPVQKIPERDPSSKWLLQTESTSSSMSKTLPPPACLPGNLPPPPPLKRKGPGRQ